MTGARIAELTGVSTATVSRVLRRLGLSRLLSSLDPEEPARRYEHPAAGDELRLTSREFSLLEYLMRRRGDVVTKADILGHVWDYAFDGDPNIVEVYVGRLRRKVDRPFGRADIETLRGSGYRLRDAG